MHGNITMPAAQTTKTIKLNDKISLYYKLKKFDIHFKLYMNSKFNIFVMLVKYDETCWMFYSSNNLIFQRYKIHYH